MQNKQESDQLILICRNWWHEFMCELTAYFNRMSLCCISELCRCGEWRQWFMWLEQCVRQWLWRQRRGSSIVPWSPHTRKHQHQEARSTHETTNYRNDDRLSEVIRHRCVRNKYKWHSKGSSWRKTTYNWHCDRLWEVDRWRAVGISRVSQSNLNITGWMVIINKQLNYIEFFPIQQ